MRTNIQFIWAGLMFMHICYYFFLFCFIMCNKAPSTASLAFYLYSNWYLRKNGHFLKNRMFTKEYFWTVCFDNCHKTLYLRKFYEPLTPMHKIEIKWNIQFYENFERAITQSQIDWQTSEFFHRIKMHRIGKNWILFLWRTFKMKKN